ncbi:MAG: pentapeptide repeat-containing protein [Marinifilaceae bacterium]|jgi:uncharacterized protein YjbI with pentapeptide repeats|nr:pentapeptide repeat-containing protein [Marinifilaceae bacterium]
MIYDAIIDDSNYGDLNSEYYENCKFLNIEFKDEDLSRKKFIDCEFSECSLCNISFVDTNLSNVLFKFCKILGVNFTGLNDIVLSMRFVKSSLDYSTFESMNLTYSSFDSSSLKAVDLSNSDMSGIKIYNCDLTDAVFFRTKLIKTNFSESYNLFINPVNNIMKNAIIPFSEAQNLLDFSGVKLV